MKNILQKDSYLPDRGAVCYNYPVCKKQSAGEIFMKKLLWALLVLSALLCASAMAEAKDITSNCKFWASEGSVSAVTDSSIKTAWEPSANAEIRIGFPADAAYLAVEWEDDPTGYVFVQYDENQNPFKELTEADSFVGMSQVFTLDDAARFASLKLTQNGQRIQKIRVYSEGELPISVRNFLPAHEKCDLMVVSAHQDDEWIFFGGIMPYYEYVQEKKVQMVYMANCGRTRKNEALNGLWAGGMKHHPYFIDLKDENLSSINEALEHWGGKEGLTEILVDTIRRFKPEVILTHDIDGEYGHNQHKLTSRAMETAIIAAADPARFPDSYGKYGAWQVKKLYLHLAPNAIDFDWNVKYDQLRGYTPLEVARIAYSKHESQQKYYQVEDGGKYDNSLFGLTYSTVGEDVRKDDLFENIVSVPENTPLPEPVGTAEPPVTIPPAESNEIVPEISPEPTTAPVPVREKGGSGAGLIIGIAAGIAVIGAGAGLYLHQRKLRRRKRRRRVRR